MAERRVLAGLRLGKEAKREDPRTFKLARYLDVRAVLGLPAYPGTYDLSGPVPTWPMYQNDVLGDCAIAAPAHITQGWTANASTEFRMRDEDVLAAYQVVGGYRPGDPSTDNGCNMLDVLNYWRQAGIGGRKVLVFAEIDLRNHSEVKAALWLFGGIYLGLALPVTAQSQVGGRWQVPKSMRGNGAPNSWGGHAVNLIGHNRAGVRCVTWGMEQPMTWGFFDAYADEGYAVLSPDWFRADGTTPMGFDLEALRKDLGRVTADGR